MTKSVVGSMSEWSGVLKDFFRQIHDGSHTLESVKAFNEHRNPFQTAVDIGAMTADWQNFYRKFFALDMDFSGIRIPAMRAGFDCLIIVAQGLTPNKVYDVCQQNFKCWRYTDDLDKATQGLNEREPTETYAIWVRDRIEADEEHKNKSANQIKAKGLTTETLLERELHELKVFDETDGHLDIQNVTLCTGSRVRDGGVPSADWGSGKFRVRWYSPQFANDRLRSRETVS
ncbi:MAG: hypothetical protein HYV54_01000 [Parcubacteria group bacterium]|nr:hypothetical protein [Parcubacteria group bacterium]